LVKISKKMKEVVRDFKEDDTFEGLLDKEE
jgi:hypothetical protein